MKLKNKCSGEIKEFVLFDDRNELQGGATLKDLVEEWEDYEEPTTYYYISDFGGIREGDVGKFVDDEIDRKEIGNYFETKEEAEKAVEKLKAITRLKSCGFKFKGWRTADLGADKYYFIITAESDGAGKGDLDLLFCTEDKT